MARLISFILLLLSFLILNSTFLIRPAYAIVDPLASPNNKFGIHIISAVPDEASPAAQLVNSTGGDWGYITVLVESGSRDHDKWQTFFNDLRRRHLIPIVRLATQPDGSFWKLPYDGEEIAWADFLDRLVWPTKNRYVSIYNEPNQGQEWAGKIDPSSYAQVLDKTINALKKKNDDFFVLNAGFDASAPNKYPLYEAEADFLKGMDAAVPGIFNKLDGWVSHSYPNPGFAGSPDDSGQGTVRTWVWEMEQLKNLGVTKDLPVFITETGWKHAEGLNFDKSLPTADTVAGYMQKAFQNVWTDSQIVAVTPFLLSYQQEPFDHFSFKKLTGDPQNMKILGATFPEYYPTYQSMLDLPKTAGRPKQDNKASLVKGEIYKSIVAGESYTIPLTFKNMGQSIWNEYGQLKLVASDGQTELGIQSVELPTNQKVEPGQEATFNVSIKAPQSGTFKVSFQLFDGWQSFDQKPLEFTTEVKSPVILLVNSTLAWKDNFSGIYFLSVASDVINNMIQVELNDQGQSQPIEAKYLLPDYTFNFTLQKQFYKPRTIQAKVTSGANRLDFGTLDPDFFSALLNPKELWKILPFSK